MWPISFVRFKQSRIFKSKSSPRSRKKATDVATAAPTSLEEAQEALRRAQEDRLDVARSRGRTAEILKRLDALLAENHFAERIRGTWT
jgi:hypothetical protein